MTLIDYRQVYQLPDKIPDIALSTAERNLGGLSGLKDVPRLSRKLSKICHEHRIDCVLSFLSRPTFIATTARLFNKGLKVIASERCFPSVAYNVKPGYRLEYLILVSNQFGPDLINVYGFIKPAGVGGDEAP